MSHRRSTMIAALALGLMTGCQSQPAADDMAGMEAVEATAVEVPIALIEHRILVPVTFGGSPTFFILDTAASGHVISPELRAQVEPSPDEIRTQEVQGSTGATTMEFVKLHALGFGEDTHDDQWAVVADLSEFRDFEGREVTGILGTGVLSQYGFEIDVPANVLRLYPLGTGLQHEAGAPVLPFHSYQDTNFLQFEATISGEPVNVVLDSGARNGILNWQAARLAGATPETAEQIEGESATGGISGKKIPQYRASLGDICFGTHCLPEREMRISDLTVFDILGWEGEPAMLVGVEWLKSCPLSVSYSSRELGLCAPT